LFFVMCFISFEYSLDARIITYTFTCAHFQEYLQASIARRAALSAARVGGTGEESEHGVQWGPGYASDDVEGYGWRTAGHSVEARDDSRYFPEPAPLDDDVDDERMVFDGHEEDAMDDLDHSQDDSDASDEF
jgi:hypothetical protein